MTIIISMLCDNGVVVGCDGMASNNLGSMNFVGIDNLKTEVIHDKFIVACAGDDSLMTLFINYLKLNYDLTRQHENSDDLAFSIVNGFHEYCNKQYLVPLFNSVQVINNIPIILDPIKNQLASDFYKRVSEQFDAIIAFELKGEHFVYSLKGFQPPEMMRNKGIWYRIIGSGLLIGLPSIHLIKNILNIKEMPSIEKAIQLTYWTINHAIEASSGGIGREIKITKLAREQDSSTYRIENVDVTGTKEYIKSVYEHIHTFFGDTMSSDEVNKAPSL